MKRKLLWGLLALLVLVVGSVVLFQRQIGERLFAAAIDARVGGNAMVLEDGLHLVLCGTGSPLPNPDRAGPCSVVIAGNQAFVVDAGEGAARNLNLIGYDIPGTDGLLLTHFHSDHIDGMGPLALMYWTQGTAKVPLPVYGPEGVEQVVEGFNSFYALDKTYRIAHHGEKIVPPTGGGATAMPFAIGDQPVVVLERNGLKITAVRVDHDPVKPSVGYRFDYKGRSIVISGDAARSPQLEKVAKGADILVHDALQPMLVGRMSEALDRRGQPNTAQITRDILDYHASPEDAAKSAAAAGVKRLVLSHLVPPLPSRFVYPAFLGDAAEYFDGEITVGEDGMVFSLLPNSQSITLDKRL